MLHSLTFLPRAYQADIHINMHRRPLHSMDVMHLRGVQAGCTCMQKLPGMPVSLTT